MEWLFALILLILTSPIFLAAMFLMKLTDPGPIFFRQVRTGYLGKEFRPFKLRSMHARRIPDPHELITDDHPDLTYLGVILRRWRVDELPQLLNVLRAEMTLIGPRPTLPEQTRNYDEFQRRRLSARPGMTGLAQVNGNTSISWDERIKYDVHYAAHCGFVMDMVILLKTVLVVLLGERRFARPFDESPYNARP